MNRSVLIVLLFVSCYGNARCEVDLDENAQKLREASGYRQFLDDTLKRFDIEKQTESAEDDSKRYDYPDTTFGKDYDLGEPLEQKSFEIDRKPPVKDALKPETQDQNYSTVDAKIRTPIYTFLVFNGILCLFVLRKFLTK